MPFCIKSIVFSLLCSSTVAAIELTQCRIGDEGNHLPRTKALCGTLSVAENRANPSRFIDLNIAVVKTRSLNKKDDPVIMLAGGPGQSSVATYNSVASAFQEILKNRDVVLVDQRGSGGNYLPLPVLV